MQLQTAIPSLTTGGAKAQIAHIILICIEFVETRMEVSCYFFHIHSCSLLVCDFIVYDYVVIDTSGLSRLMLNSRFEGWKQTAGENVCGANRNDIMAVTLTNVLLLSRTSVSFRSKLNLMTWPSLFRYTTSESERESRAWTVERKTSVNCAFTVKNDALSCELMVPRNSERNGTFFHCNCMWNMLYIHECQLPTRTSIASGMHHERPPPWS